MTSEECGSGARSKENMEARAVRFRAFTVLQPPDAGHVDVDDLAYLHNLETTSAFARPATSSSQPPIRPGCSATTAPSVPPPWSPPGSAAPSPSDTPQSSPPPAAPASQSIHSSATFPLDMANMVFSTDTDA
ncbi:hypothetical protein E4U53_006047 [Claviceps sorghi]|nr:hypothetical protein E4U53_006047 [Claviceps sorghi]